MSTRAVYTFKDDRDTDIHVYKHHDGYPEGAAEWIFEAVSALKKTPGWEDNITKDGLAASFVMTHLTFFTDHYKTHGDLEYRYEITTENQEVYVKAYIHKGYKSYEHIYEEIFSGTLEDFMKKFEVYKEVCNG
nr:hypothetical protein 26 [bacterium]